MQERVFVSSQSTGFQRSTSKSVMGYHNWGLNVFIRFTQFASELRLLPSPLQKPKLMSNTSEQQTFQGAGCQKCGDIEKRKQFSSGQSSSEWYRASFVTQCLRYQPQLNHSMKEGLDPLQSNDWSTELSLTSDSHAVFLLTVCSVSLNRACPLSPPIRSWNERL